MIETIDHDRDTREHILVVSAQLFSERGFASVSIRDICDQAGVSPPTIYHYFDNKDRLFQEVIQKTLSLHGFREALITAVQSQSDPADRLCEFIRLGLSDFPRNFFNPGMFLQGSTQINQASVTRVAAELQAVEDLVLEIIQDGITKGIFRRVDPFQTRRLLMNIMLAYVLTDVHYQPNDRMGDTALYIFEMMMNGLRQPVLAVQPERLDRNS